jgi:hypothetical protein
MLTLKRSLFFIALLFAFAGIAQSQRETIIEGKVVVESTGKPVAKVHVFILDGEEEALTNSDGEFKIRSWQKAPFRITVKNYGNYKDETVTVSNPSQKVIIRLKSK